MSKQADELIEQLLAESYGDIDYILMAAKAYLVRGDMLQEERDEVIAYAKALEDHYDETRSIQWTQKKYYNLEKPKRPEWMT
jgi:hypothetical protein